MVTLDGVTFTYHGADTPSLENFSFHADKGECVVLTGESGCGKTTVTRLINGLIPDFYEGGLCGDVVVDGRRIADLESWEVASRVGCVFQNPKSQFFNLDTTGEVVFGMENLAVDREEMRLRYGRTVKELDIGALMGRSIFEMSGGQKQSIAFASVRAVEPEVYVLDEPSSNLDPAAMERLADHIRRVKRDGATVIVAEHRLFYLADVADRLVCMRDGRVVGDWSTAEFTALDDKVRESLCMRALVPPDVSALEGIRGNAEATPACETRRVSAGYGGDPALESRSLSIDYGEVVGITGKNGTGKTTLFRCVCGLHKEDSGHVRFDGRPVSARKRHEKAFLVMQDPDYQLFRQSVRDEVLPRGASEADRERATELLEHFGLSPYAKRHPASLSGGQKQRVVCALSAMSGAKVLLFDEPTSGLDYANMVRLVRFVKEFAGHGRAVGVISHDAEFLARVCSRIVRFE